MKLRTKLITPPNIHFYISDSNIPDSAPLGEELEIGFNGLCLTVPCRYEFEGSTELIVGKYQDVPKNDLLVFSGSIPTPSKKLLFHDFLSNELLSYPVIETTTQLRLWTDGLRLPERVVVGII